MSKKIDKKIKEIVEIFNKAGFETIKSCQGHLGSDFHCSFPWIAFYQGSHLKYLRFLIDKYNEKENVEKWEIIYMDKFKDKAIYFLKPKYCYKNLEYLQTEINHLSQYIKKYTI